MPRIEPAIDTFYTIFEISVTEQVILEVLRGLKKRLWLESNAFVFPLRTADGHQPNDLIISINVSFRRWDSPFEACWKLNDIRHCTTINVSLRDLFSPGSPAIWLHYSFTLKNVSRRDVLVPGVPFHKNDLTSLIHRKISQYIQIIYILYYI